MLREAVYGLSHAVEEKRLRFVLTAVPIRRGDQFLSLRNSDSREQSGKNRAKRATQPDIEEVR